MKQIKKKNKRMREIETKLGEDIEEVLRRMFVDENKSRKQIADELHISSLTVLRWCDLAGIRSRKLNVEGDT